MFSLLGLLGSFLGGGGGGSSTQNQEYESTTDGKSRIRRSELPKEVLDALSGLFTNGQLQANQTQVQTALGANLAAVQDAAANPFDQKAYINGIMTSANNTANNDLVAGLGKTVMATGGSLEGNSMSALLANKLKTDTASQLAGIQSEATAQAAQLAQGQQESATNQSLALSAGLTKNLTDMLTLFRGAQTNQTQTSTEHTKGTGTSTTEQPFNWLQGLGGLLNNFNTPVT